jgi:LysM repeat protein
MPATQAPPARGGKGGFLTQKVAGVPLWLGMGGGLLLLLVVANFRANKNAAAGSSGSTTAGAVPADQVPETIFQNYTTTQVTNNEPAPAPDDDDTPPNVPPVVPPKGPPPKNPPPKKGGPPPRPPRKGGPRPPLEYKVKHGDTLSGIAQRYGTTWQALWAYNTRAGVRPASTIKTLKERGPNLLYSGETILIPQK